MPIGLIPGALLRQVDGCHDQADAGGEQADQGTQKALVGEPGPGPGAVEAVLDRDDHGRAGGQLQRTYVRWIADASTLSRIARSPVVFGLETGRNMCRSVACSI